MSAAAQRRPRGAQDRRGVGQLVQGVLEIDQVVLAGVARLLGRPVTDRDPVGQAGGFHRSPSSRHGIGLELDTDELEVREASRHRDEPSPAAAVHVDDATAAAEVSDELGQLGERLLEEDRDVLGRQALDRHAVSVGPLADRPTRSEELDHAAPVERRDGRVNELAAEIFRPVGVEQDRRDLVMAGQAIALERREIVGISGPCPRLDGRLMALGRSGELAGSESAGTGLPERIEQAELDAEVHQP